MSKLAAVSLGHGCLAEYRSQFHPSWRLASVDGMRQVRDVECLSHVQKKTGAQAGLWMTPSADAA
ncbi:hypothetical protein FHR53_002143 [Xanthomonas arboricola]